MGYDIRFIAFRKQPDVAALKSAAWITAFRLFRDKTAPHWFLEGPSEAGDAITFQKPLLVDMGQAGEAMKDAQREMARLQVGLKDVSGHAKGLDDEALLQGLIISRLGKEPVFVAFGNDAGMDGAIVCSAGKIIAGKLQADAQNALAIGKDGSLSAEALLRFGEDPDLRNFYQIISDEGSRYFRLFGPLPVPSDMTEDDTQFYELVASKSA